MRGVFVKFKKHHKSHSGARAESADKRTECDFAGDKALRKNNRRGTVRNKPNQRGQKRLENCVRAKKVKNIVADRVFHNKLKRERHQKYKNKNFHRVNERRLQNSVVARLAVTVKMRVPFLFFALVSRFGFYDEIRYISEKRCDYKLYSQNFKRIGKKRRVCDKNGHSLVRR